MVDTVQPQRLLSFANRLASSLRRETMPEGEEVRSALQQNVSPGAEGLEVKEIFSPSGRGRSVSLDIPLYRTGVSVNYPETETVAWSLVRCRFTDSFASK